MSFNHKSINKPFYPLSFALFFKKLLSGHINKRRIIDDNSESVDEMRISSSQKVFNKIILEKWRFQAFFHTLGEKQMF
jgi:hypothetical protein